MPHAICMYLYIYIYAFDTYEHVTVAYTINVCRIYKIIYELGTFRG